MATSRKRNISIDILVDDRQVNQKLGKIDQQVTKTGKAFSAAGKLMGGLLVGREIVDFARQSIQAFSDLEQSVGGVESVFGDAADTILEMAKTADQSAGLSEAAFNTVATRIGGMLQNLGFSADEAADKTIELIGVGSDLAATYGGTVQEAMDAISSMLRGETDPVERYAVSIKQTDVNARAMALGLAESTDAVGKEAKAVAALDLFMGQAAKTRGQFARESKTIAGQEARLTAEWENQQALIGQELAPAWAEILETTNDLIPAFGDLAGSAADAVASLGPVVGLLGDAAEAYANLRGAQDEAMGSGNPFERIMGFLGHAMTQGVAKTWSEIFDALGGGLSEAEQEALDTERSISKLTEAEKANWVAQSDLTLATKEGTEALEDNTEARLENYDAIQESLDPLFDLSEKTDAVVEAQRDYNEALEEHGPKSKAARDAQMDLFEAKMDLHRAEIAVEEAAGLTREEFVKQSVQMGLTRREAEKLANRFERLDGFEFKAKTISIKVTPGGGATTVTTDDGGTITTRLPEFGAGGVVPGPVGARRLVIAHGGETVLPTHKAPGAPTQVFNFNGPVASQHEAEKWFREMNELARRT